MSRLRKSSTEKMIFGVCGGLADHFNMDTTIIRLLFVLFALLGAGTSVIVYIVLAIVMPSD
jgi:phage shock protein C